MRFSQRIGATEVRSLIQVETIDMPLRNKLWSLIYLHLSPESESGLGVRSSRYQKLYHDAWLNLLERPIDEMPRYVSRVVDVMREYFYGADWFRPYDMLEFCLTRQNGFGADAIKMANRTLEEHLSGYRFVSEKLVPVTDDSHVQAIEDALSVANAPARIHLRKSLALLGERQSPDVENAMKEAISAVEATCSALVGKPGSTLGEALKKMEESEVLLHPALKGSWLKMYGYTSGADGIRHALQGESSATVDDALYFLIACSAFVSLLTAKAASAGIPLAAT
ncbi:AbiJ-NTD4 domain-containing protein [Cellulomonas wangsupingiae]|uniref:HEPN AbiJ-N-terminal domain-containing protein n=1 Tax=Cellulomonas wangsupingiae TaxID=2968085 RepID=A0ABY5K6I5_9CELL|nr:hypothetical protein [Cellulomonas wangsupingiae]MCC2334388.1 hypothetical protein [Cellulomonas wangsupingiae]UUI66057.1 hypothetical protein NP075_04835 [Cellulomonas wangsupingiae]